MDQSSKDDTLPGVRPSPEPGKGAVSHQSSRDKRAKRSLPGSTVRKKGRAISGRVVHFEIPAGDVGRARDFYHAAFGWDLTSLPKLDYTLVRTAASDEQGMPTEPGAINGGMCRREPPVTAPVVTIEVEDIDAALRTVESLGGATEAAKQPVGDMGFAAYFRGSEGNLMGLWPSAG